MRYLKIFSPVTAFSVQMCLVSLLVYNETLYQVLSSASNFEESRTTTAAHIAALSNFRMTQPSVALCRLTHVPSCGYRHSLQTTRKFAACCRLCKLRRWSIRQVCSPTCCRIRFCTLMSQVFIMFWWHWLLCSYINSTVLTPITPVNPILCSPSWRGPATHAAKTVSTAAAATTTTGFLATTPPCAADSIGGPT